MDGKFKISVVVPARLLTPIVELLNNEGSLLSVEPYLEQQPVTQPTTRRRKGYYTTPSERRSPQLVLSTMRSQAIGITWRVSEIQAKCGIPSGTVSSALSYLRNDGYVANVGPSMWQLVPGK